ncbi:MAG: response regulator [Gammaproteobacteria bacterium]|nr:response regulator [Gammaproteobacteria bacterium]
MTVRSQAEWLKYRILVFTIVGIIFTASIVGISVAFPFYSFVKADNDRSLTLIATSRSSLIEAYLNGLGSIAMQVTTRTFARQQLEKYLHGDMGRQELEYTSSPVLDDAMRLLPELIAIIRHDIKGQPLLHVGMPLGEFSWRIPAKGINRPRVNGPIMVDGKYYIYVTAPIFNRKKEQLGTDMLVFQLTELKAIISDASGLGESGRVELGWQDESGMHLLLKPKNSDRNDSLISGSSPLAVAISHAINGQSGILAGAYTTDDDYMTAYSPVADTGWAVAVSMSRAELYTSVKRQMLFTGSMMLILIVLGAVASFILIRPLSGKILLHADELKQQIDKKTVELQHVNQSLEALNAVNEVLVRTSSESDLLDEICRIIVDVAGFNLAWIGLVNSKDKQQVNAVKQYGSKDICVDMNQLMQDGAAWSRSPAGLAMQTGEPCVVNNIGTSGCFGAFWHRTGNCDCVAVAGFPLMVGGHTLGVLLVYAAFTDAFYDEQVSLMQRLADNLAFGLVTLQDRSDRQKLERQLLQSQKMEAIGQLTGGIAHDFNNILASILGYTELLQTIFIEEQQNTQVLDYLNRIEKSGNRARDLVSQMLAFSRGSASESRPLLLEPLVKEALTMLMSTIPSSIKLNSFIDDETVTVMMDPVQFHQMIMNLCINARDAMEGVGSIDIILRRVELHDVECRSCYQSLQGFFEELVVSDSGSGIATEVLERIFDPFFTTKEIGKGTGMGLSMVHGIMHEHGGHILVESVAGQGTAFHLLFPLVDKEKNLPVKETTKDVVSHQPDAISTKHILVVDDDVMVAEFERELLQHRGYRVTMKVDSQEALDLFKKNPRQFDLVLTDQAMPGITGVEMAQAILAIAPQTPVILCTGYSEYIDEQSAEQIGIYAFMDKPIDMQKLLSIIDSI